MKRVYKYSTFEPIVLIVNLLYWLKCNRWYQSYAIFHHRNEWSNYK